MQIKFGETVIFNIFEKDRSLLSFLRKDDVSSSLKNCLAYGTTYYL